MGNIFSTGIKLVCVKNYICRKYDFVTETKNGLVSYYFE